MRQGIDYHPGRPEAHAEKPFFRLVLIRHEEVDYTRVDHTGKDPTLTPEGEARAEEIGRRLIEEGLLDTEEPLHLVHSPQGRTEQTLRGILKGAGMSEDLPARSIRQLRTADKGENYQEFVDAALSVLHEEGGLNEAAWDKITKEQYGDGTLYTSRPDVVETKESRKKRLYRSLEYLIRWKDARSSEDDAQQVVAVSHFEIIMHLIDDVFGIENFPTHNLPNFGDYLVVEAFRTGSPEIVRVRVKFKEKEKEMLFDRGTRSVKEID